MNKSHIMDDDREQISLISVRLKRKFKITISYPISQMEILTFISITKDTFDTPGW